MTCIDHVWCRRRCCPFPAFRGAMGIPPDELQSRRCAAFTRRPPAPVEDVYAPVLWPVAPSFAAAARLQRVACAPSFLRPSTLTPASPTRLCVMALHPALIVVRASVGGGGCFEASISNHLHPPPPSSPQNQQHPPAMSSCMYGSGYTNAQCATLLLAWSVVAGCTVWGSSVSSHHCALSLTA